MTADESGIRAFQRRIEEIYYERDASRGVPRTFMWFVEEVGELARDLLRDATNRDPTNRGNERSEFADCLAWLATLASLRGIDLGECAWEKYRDGCPRCGGVPCTCAHRT